MAQILHQRATTTHAVRAEIQRSTALVAELSRTYNLKPKTVRKWRQQASTEDERMGPKVPHSPSLTEMKRADAITSRRNNYLPLDKCLFALQCFVPHLPHSSLHRLYKRNDISRLPSAARLRTKGQAFRDYPIGYLYLDICEIHAGEGRASLFVTIEYTSKFAHARIYHKANRDQTAAFLEDTAQQLPYRVNTVLTDNSVQFASHRGTEAYKPYRFDVVCREQGIKHCLTRPFHPWDNGQSN